jgi:hypothetical protein
LTITTKQLGDHGELHYCGDEAATAVVAAVRNMVVEMPTDVLAKRWQW